MPGIPAGVVPPAGANVVILNNGVMNSGNTNVFNSITFSAGSGGISGPVPINVGASGVLVDATAPAAISNAVPIVFSAEGLITVPAGDNLTLTGTLTASSGITKLGTGTLTLTVDNSATVTGTGFTVSGGMLSVSADNQLGAAGLPVALGGSTLQVTGTTAVATTRNITLGAASGTLNVTNTAGFTVTGLLSGTGGLFKTGAGQLTLATANTYSGVTTISGGILTANIIANGGTASAIGNASNAATNLVLDGGTLQYVGTVVGNTDHLFTLTTNGGGIDSSSPVAANYLNFTNGGAIVLAPGSAATRTLTLTGTNVSVTNANEEETGTLNQINCVIGNLDAKPYHDASPRLRDPGLWDLKANNTYGSTNPVTITTNVNAGALCMDNANAVGGISGVNVAQGAMLTFALAPMTVANNITLNGITTGLPLTIACNGALCGNNRGGGNQNILSGTLTLNANSNISTSYNDKKPRDHRPGHRRGRAARSMSSTPPPSLATSRWPIQITTTAARRRSAPTATRCSAWAGRTTRSRRRARQARSARVRWW